MDNTFIRVFNKIGGSISKFGTVHLSVVQRGEMNRLNHDLVAEGDVRPGESWGVLYARLHDRLNKLSFDDKDLVKWITISFDEKEYKTNINVCLKAKNES